MKRFFAFDFVNISISCEGLIKYLSIYLFEIHCGVNHSFTRQQVSHYTVVLGYTKAALNGLRRSFFFFFYYHIDLSDHMCKTFIEGNLWGRTFFWVGGEKHIAAATHLCYQKDAAAEWMEVCSCDDMLCVLMWMRQMSSGLFESPAPITVDHHGQLAQLTCLLTITYMHLVAEAKKKSLILHFLYFKEYLITCNSHLRQHQAEGVNTILD